ncbi:hypothetical protein PLESHI_10700 [Plesiomonas shigelloides 302-73]|uniref:Uncharacterized protein n=1 Tax=Plesiomonas shigelloides 302-73 TaxID=1315976 RepID=R8AQ18_PLESH|nr:hypothetical protein PLESHI_10700 [Plesiomonas shigelloides 302-73]
MLTLHQIKLVLLYGMPTRNNITLRVARSYPPRTRASMLTLDYIAHWMSRYKMGTLNLIAIYMGKMITLVSNCFTLPSLPGAVQNIISALDT